MSRWHSIYKMKKGNKLKQHLHEQGKSNYLELLNIQSQCLHNTQMEGEVLFFKFTLKKSCSNADSQKAEGSEKGWRIKASRSSRSALRTGLRFYIMWSPTQYWLLHCRGHHTMCTPLKARLHELMLLLEGLFRVPERHKQQRRFASPWLNRNVPRKVEV